MKSIKILFIFILLCACCVVALFIGAFSVDISEIFSLFNKDSLESIILFESRIPRILAAVVIGASLSLSGAIYQGVIGNPLVSPGILGVLSGASFGAALGLTLGAGVIFVELLCFGFGVFAMCFALFLSYLFDRQQSILMLILSGIISGSLFSAAVSVIKILADPYNSLPNIVYWLLGSLANVQNNSLIIAAVALACVLMLSIFFAKVLDILNLDTNSAYALGVNVKVARLIFLAFATLLAALSVSLGGIIGWVGLVIPHISRFIIGANHRYLLPFCAIFGALFLLLCDTFARSISDVEIPIGIVTSIFGIPLFILILLKRRVK